MAHGAIDALHAIGVGVSETAMYTGLKLQLAQAQARTFTAMRALSICMHAWGCADNFVANLHVALSTAGGAGYIPGQGQ